MVLLSGEVCFLPLRAIERMSTEGSVSDCGISWTDLLFSGSLTASVCEVVFALF